jgi:hypothetical protein
MWSRMLAYPTAEAPERRLAQGGTGEKWTSDDPARLPPAMIQQANASIVRGETNQIDKSCQQPWWWLLIPGPAIING